MKNYEIRDINLAPLGRQKIDWVKNNMPLLSGMEEEFKITKPFQGIKVTLSVHMEAKTAYLCEVLAAGGAQMSVTGSNVLSTPVSYTHLRAHETRHDLVCRLLLEKKKKTKQTIKKKVLYRQTKNKKKNNSRIR